MAIYSAMIIQLWEIKCKSMRDGSAYILPHFCLSLKRDGDFSLFLDAEKQTGLSSSLFLSISQVAMKKERK